MRVCFGKSELVEAENVDGLDEILHFLDHRNDVVVDRDLLILDHKTNDKLKDTISDRLLLSLLLPHQTVLRIAENFRCHQVKICLVIQRLHLQQHD